MKRATTAKETVAEAVRVHVGPLLSPLGFRKSGVKYWRNTKQWCDVILFEMSRWGTSESSSVDINVGVLWHDIERLASGADDVKVPPPTYKCTYHDHFGIDGSAYGTASWPVEETTDPGALGADLAEVISKRVLPQIERVHVLENMLRVRRGGIPLTLLNELTILHLLGRKRDVEDRVLEAGKMFAEEHPDHLKETVVPFAKRLGYDAKQVKALLG